MTDYINWWGNVNIFKYTNKWSVIILAKVCSQRHNTLSCTRGLDIHNHVIEFTLPIIQHTQMKLSNHRNCRCTKSMCHFTTFPHDCAVLSFEYRQNKWPKCFQTTFLIVCFHCHQNCLYNN